MWVLQIPDIPGCLFSFETNDSNTSVSFLSNVFTTSPAVCPVGHSYPLTPLSTPVHGYHLSQNISSIELLRLTIPSDSGHEKVLPEYHPWAPSLRPRTLKCDSGVDAIEEKQHQTKPLNNLLLNEIPKLKSQPLLNHGSQCTKSFGHEFDLGLYRLAVECNECSSKLLDWSKCV